MISNVNVVRVSEIKEVRAGRSTPVLRSLRHQRLRALFASFFPDTHPPSTTTHSTSTPNTYTCGYAGCGGCCDVTLVGDCYLDECAFSLLHAHGAHLDTLDLVAPVPEEAQVWVAGITYLVAQRSFAAPLCVPLLLLLLHMLPLFTFHLHFSLPGRAPLDSP